LYAPTTLSVTDVTKTECVASGRITNDGGLTISARGICWSTNPSPTIFDNKTTEGSGTGTFTSSITGLTPGTVYYVRAYITNSLNTFYGEAVSFTTNVLFVVPFTYNFANVSYGGQTDRLNMLAALTSYIKTSHNGDKLDAQVMNNMYANENAPFTGDVGSSGKDLKNKTEANAQAEIVALFTEMAANSGDLIAVASDGVAGLVTGASRTVLVNAKGQEYAQLIDKGLMGS
jgi:hypothetical protein